MSSNNYSSSFGDVVDVDFVELDEGDEVCEDEEVALVLELLFLPFSFGFFEDDDDLLFDFAPPDSDSDPEAAAPIFVYIRFIATSRARS